MSRSAQNPSLITRSHLENIRSRSRSVSGLPPQHVQLEERFKSHIREESQKMTKNWSNSVEKLSKRPPTDQDNLRNSRHSLAYEEIRERQRREQKERIQEVENSIRRSQPGPKLLDGAALHADCLLVQERQRQEHVLRNISNRRENLRNGELIRLQNENWNREQHQRLHENRIRALHYQQDLRRLMEEKRQRQVVAVEQQVAQREAAEKERHEMERRQALQRQTATEAMRMAEQRRLREKCCEKVAEELCAIQLEGKERQEEIKEKQMRAIKNEQLQRQEAVQQKIAAILVETAEKEKATEERVLSNAAADYEQQWLAKSRAEVERKRLLKVQRIESHLKQQKREKERKEEIKRQFADSVAERLKNDQVTCEFLAAQREKRLREARELRSRLNDQWEEKRATEQAIKAGVQEFTNSHCDYSRDHQDFVAHAKEALRGARERRVPVQPLVRVINLYEKEHFVEEKPIPAHLTVRQPPVHYDRKEMKKDNSKEKIRYNIEQLRALNSVIVGKETGQDK